MCPILRKIKFLIKSIVSSMLLINTAYAQNDDNYLLNLSIEDLARINVYLASSFSAHIHDKGEIMVGVTSKFMSMSGLRDGTSDVRTTSVLSPTEDNFMIAPLDMDMHMLMGHLMYGVTDQFTLMAMFPYVKKSMNLRQRNGNEFTTKAEGFGDVKATVNYLAYRSYNHLLQVKLGLSLPTGSITKEDFNPMMGRNVRLPYPMQIGSGTYDLLPAVTYIYQQENVANLYGFDIEGTIRTGNNDQGYRLGNVYNLKAWFYHTWNQYISGQILLDASRKSNISGADTLLNPNMVPTARTDFQKRESVSVELGVELQSPNNKLKNQTLYLAYGFPVYQKFSGPQLKTSGTYTASWNIYF